MAQPFENVKIYKEMHGHPDAVAIHLFVNFDVWEFMNLGVLFLTMWINSCLSHNLPTRT